MLNKSSQELKNLMEIYANYIVFDDILSIQINENIKSFIQYLYKKEFNNFYVKLRIFFKFKAEWSSRIHLDKI